jgi:hypothetical protein
MGQLPTCQQNTQEMNTSFRLCDFWAILVIVTMLEGENGQKFLRKTSAVLFGRHFGLSSTSETDQMIFNSCLLWMQEIFYFSFI